MERGKDGRKRRLGRGGVHQEEVEGRRGRRPAGLRQEEVEVRRRVDGGGG